MLPRLRGMAKVMFHGQIRDNRQAFGLPILFP